MIYGSVCSGIEAASMAWHPLGWRAAFLSEVAPFPRAVLANHYPNVPLHGDFTTIERGQYEPIDLLVGGTPCQSFSIAGLRGGMADERGNLALEYLRLADRLRPRWLVWENVPGVLSALSHNAPDPCAPPDDMEEGAEWVGEDEYDADESHAFACFLAGLSELGYGFAYRSLDAQFFNLAQRRERVFVVGYLGDWRRAAAVLFEPAGMRGHPAPSRKAREGTAGAITGRIDRGGTNSEGGDGHLIANTLRVLSHGAAWRGDGADNFTLARCVTSGEGRHVDGESCTFAIQERAVSENPDSGPSGKGWQADVAFTLEARHHTQSIAHSLRADGFDASEDGTGRGTPLVPVSVALRGREGGATAEVGDDVAFTLRGSSGGGDKPHVMAFSGKDYGADAGEIAPTLRAMAHNSSHANAGGQLAATIGAAVRRLTPRECERLQGFPDDWTLIPWRKGLAPDGPRYKAIGNSMAVPVMRWIGARIAREDANTGWAERCAAPSPLDPTPLEALCYPSAAEGADGTERPPAAKKSGLEAWGAFRMSRARW